MLTYLALLGLPEWTTLSKVQRRFVWRRYIVPLVTRWQLAVAKTILVGLVIAALLWLGAFSRTGTTVIAFVGVVFLIPELFDLVFIARRRQQIGNIIQSHETEIRSAA